MLYLMLEIVPRLTAAKGDHVWQIFVPWKLIILELHNAFVSANRLGGILGYIAMQSIMGPNALTIRANIYWMSWRPGTSAFAGIRVLIINITYNAMCLLSGLSC